MIGKYRDGVVPDADPAPEIAMQFDGLATTIRQRIDRVEVSAALEDVWERVRALNRYVTDSEPWKLAKDEAAAVELDVVLYTLAEGLRVVSVLLAPWMPATTERLLAALGQPSLSLEAAELGAVGGGATLGELGQLFPRIEPRAEAPA
jgi:methionyl-tRNA synthetase